MYQQDNYIVDVVFSRAIVGVCVCVCVYVCVYVCAFVSITN